MSFPKLLDNASVLYYTPEIGYFIRLYKPVGQPKEFFMEGYDHEKATWVCDRDHCSSAFYSLPCLAALAAILLRSSIRW